MTKRAVSTLDMRVQRTRRRSLRELWRGKASLRRGFGLPERELGRIQELVERHEHEIRKAWTRHFSGNR